MKIDFEFETVHGMYRDALNLPDDHGLDDAQIEALKQVRLNNWFAFITAHSTDPNVIDVDAQIVNGA